ncbi:hypothetical protein MHBO_002719 [Bonamia ostreae]|uniref:Uncharacterized protein n=1 Tax=Bonamia ostreae TaxID=126728 RepID=A0ABV2AP15_9EUKA
MVFKEVFIRIYCLSKDLSVAIFKYVLALKQNVLSPYKSYLHQNNTSTHAKFNIFHTLQINIKHCYMYYVVYCKFISIVPNLHRRAVTNYDDVCSSLKLGYKRRTIEATKMNEKSRYM